MSSLIVLRSVFLVSERNRNPFSRSNRRVGVGDDSVSGIAEDNSVQGDDLGASWCRGGCGFARPHSEEEPHYGEVSDDGEVCVSGFEAVGP